MKEEKFSIIIGINHEDKNYANVIKQVQSQDYKNLEIIVVSNRLSPKDQCIIDFLVHQDLQNRCKHLVLLNRRCPSALFNEGIACATGDYVWCINENVIFKKTTFIREVVADFKHSKAQAIYICQQKKLINNDSLDIQSNNATLRHPFSLIKQEDWQNPSRLIIRINAIQLFKLNFIEGWAHTHGSLFSIQIMRFLPNMTYKNQDSLDFCKSSAHTQDSTKIVEYILSLNYTLRYSELIFGVQSNAFKLILKREIDDNVFIKKLIDESSLLTTIKDYLKLSRQIVQSSYIDRSLNRHEIKKVNPKISELVQNICSSSKEMLREVFKHSRIKVHCGAHKTATTYIQSILNEARFDLALQGTIYIHHENLREDFIIAKRDKNIQGDVDRISYSIIRQAALLAYRSPSKLIISEENLVRPNTDIFTKWEDPSTHQTASNYSCACMRNGYDLQHLKAVASIFSGGIEIIYTVRNYFDYLLSRHSEFLKWRPFKEFDGEFININDLQNCDWKYLVSDLRNISNTISLCAFEDYKNDPLQFANYLSGYNLHNYEIQQQKNQSQKITRSRCSQKLLDELIDKKKLGYGSFDLKATFAHRIENEEQQEKKFTSKLFPNQTLKEHKKLYESEYLSNSLPHNFSFLPPLDINQFNEVQHLNILPLPERFQLSLKHDSQELKSYLNSFYKKSLYLENRTPAITKKRGITAMIRIKNEEANIYNVLDSIKNCFDEIVIIDNNSTDYTINEIQRAIENQPLLYDKIKLFHYKFDIARCGVDNFKESQSSPNSLASFYNYSLKKCNFSMICKWDGDMYLPKSMEKDFQEFLRQVLRASPSSDESTIFGVMKGMTVFKGMNNKYYTRKSLLEQEARIFPNVPGVFFIKEILWEQLFSVHKVERIISKNPTFVEFKDTKINEFAHWSIDESLGMSPRKSIELRDFNLVKRCTQNSEIEEDLESHGFEEIDASIMNFSG